MELDELGTRRVELGLHLRRSVKEQFEELALRARTFRLGNVAVHDDVAFEIQDIDVAELFLRLLVVPAERLEVALLEVEVVVFKDILGLRDVDNLRLYGRDVLLRLGSRVLVGLDFLDRAGDFDDILLLQAVAIRQERALLVQFYLEPQGRSREDQEQIHEDVQCFIHISIFLYVTVK